MRKFECLSNNTLKIIACVSMFLDHLGFLVFTEVELLRILGRIAFPIFAYMLAEGCFYTRNKLKHFLIILAFGVIIQIVMFLFSGYTRFNIFLVFSASIVLIYAFDWINKSVKDKDGRQFSVAVILFVGLGLLFCAIELNTWLFFDNYSLYGIFTPVVLYILKTTLPKFQKTSMLIALAILSIIYAISMDYVMYYLLLAIPLLALYNGERGKLNMKYFFYVFYPAHFVFLEILSQIL